MGFGVLGGLGGGLGACTAGGGPSGGLGACGAGVEGGGRGRCCLRIELTSRALVTAGPCTLVAGLAVLRVLVVWVTVAWGAAGCGMGAVAHHLAGCWGWWWAQLGLLGQRRGPGRHGAGSSPSAHSMM
jgi:hypothetical protein